MNTAYDIIGDIHGHADVLERLLQKLGYQLTGGVYSHPDKRQVVFVGDFIDRGPKIRETLHLVKAMCDAGHALAVMGNHEFNAICFHTPRRENGGYFRDHGWKEINQHMATLEQFKHHPEEWIMFLDWFTQLPLWLDEESFRVVHACWDDNHIEYLSQREINYGQQFLTLAADEFKQTPEYFALEELLKGKEVVLPAGVDFVDKDGAIRNECRIRWWSDSADRKIYSDLLMECPDALNAVRARLYNL